MEFEVPFFEHVETNDYENVESWRALPYRSRDDTMKTGDILFFSGSSLMSSGLKFFTFSRWNHIGMVCWVELTYKKSPEDESSDSPRKSIDMYCFELGSQPYTDLMSKKKIDKGVRLVRLADITLMYDVIALRRIKAKRTKEWMDKFQKFMIDWNKTPFFSFKTTVKAYYVTPGSNKNETTCAQLTANMLKHMEVNKTDFDTSQVSPEHFTCDSKAFDDNIFLGPEVVIYRDNGKINVRLIFVVIVLVFIFILIMVISKQRKNNGGGDKA